MTSKPSALTSFFLLLCLSSAMTMAESKDAGKPTEPSPAKEAGAAEGSKPEKGDEKPAAAADAPADEERDAENTEAADPAVARPVSADPVQVYGWREWIHLSDGNGEGKLQAKLDSGALTSSMHCEEKELFERDGKKWVRFVVTDRSEKDGAPKLRMEAPLVRIATIKEPGGTSETREVVRLSFRIGDRKMKADFTLNNRANMLSPILIGRTALKELGWVDPSRAYLADKKVLR